MNKIWIALVVIAIQSANVQAQSVGESLTFQITNFDNDSGQALVMLFRQTDKVPSQPFRQAKALIASKEATVHFEDLPYGDYAAILIHDQNANGMVDHKWGFPNEPLAYTNHWKLSLLSGMPVFSKLRFSFSQETKVYRIAINP